MRDEDNKALVDSQTVLSAIQRDSYGYQTFFANHMGEIQKAGPIVDWWWIPGELNIADIMTLRCTAEDLKEGCVWQNGQEFLSWPVESLPKKSAEDVVAHARREFKQTPEKSFHSSSDQKSGKERAAPAKHSDKL